MFSVPCHLLQMLTDMHALVCKIPRQFDISSTETFSNRVPINVFSDIRQQLSEQLKCLESRLEIQTSMVQEIQEFYRRKADLEAEYSRNLDKLVRSTWARHKQEKQRY
jgi:hypothetical protein